MLKKRSNYQKQTKPTNSKNKRDAYAGKYKNMKASMATKNKYTAPIVRNLSGNDNIKDYQARIIYPQYYSTNFGQQGNFVGFTKGILSAALIADDQAQGLSITVPGTANDNRNGNRIVCKSLNIIMNIRPPIIGVPDAALPWVRGPNGVEVANTTVAGVWRQSRLARVVIFIDQTSSGKVPQVKEIFNLGTLSAGAQNVANVSEMFTVTSQLRPDATTRFKIICNELVTIPHDDSILWSRYIPLEGLAITYLNANDTPGNVNTNGIFMFVLSDVAYLDSIGADADQQALVRNSLVRFDYSAKLRFIP